MFIASKELGIEYTKINMWRYVENDISSIDEDSIIYTDPTENKRAIHDNNGGTPYGKNSRTC